MTARNLAVEAGFSPKQLYTWLSRLEDVRQHWTAVREHDRHQPESAASSEVSEVEVLRRRIGELERTVSDWKAIATLGRAECERLQAVIDRLRQENTRLCPPADAHILPLRP